MIENDPQDSEINPKCAAYYCAGHQSVCKPEKTHGVAEDEAEEQ